MIELRRPRGTQAARPLRAPQGSPMPRLRAARGGARFGAAVTPPIGTGPRAPSSGPPRECGTLAAITPGRPLNKWRAE